MNNIEKKVMEDNQVHYFTSSFANWATSASLDECIKKQRKADKGLGTKKPIEFMVFLVPHPEDTHYEINQYVPVDVDAMLIARL